MNDLWLLMLVLACLVLSMAQVAGLGAWRMGIIALALALMLVAAGTTASHTSMAALGQWLAVPQRRLDLAAILLLEALLFSQQAIMSVQHPRNRYWNLLGSIPPPSLWIVLFLALVWTMLEIDGVDFATLTWVCAIIFPALLWAGGVLLQHWLPDPLMRTGLRLCLHLVQLAAGLWLARPLQQAVQFKTPAMWERLGIVLVLVLFLMALGWLWQRGVIAFKRNS